jgi:antitoxin VapB
MPLTIRDPRAGELARELADMQGTTMTEAVIGVLKQEVERKRKELPLEVRIDAIIEKARRMAGPNGRTMTKEEIDDLWTAE